MAGLFSDLQLPSFLWPHVAVNPEMRFLVRGGNVVEHFEGVKSTEAGVTLPAFTFGCHIEAAQGPLCPGLYPQLQLLFTGISLQIPPNRLLLLLTTFQESLSMRWRKTQRSWGVMWPFF